ncbi:MAG: low molecular weight phosphotyrosine protein phosphatase [Verrucomicrobia bacterium]|nr:low molecular weight phosphotyrosine protein phosphatase [Verrucomicrobiota bacterium]
MDPFKVLFVCWGNICRSPAAECVFQKQIDEQGLGDQITCDSAGTIGMHAGQPPDARMREAGAKRSISFFGRSRKFRPSDFNEFDLILAMDHSNMADLQASMPIGDSKAVLGLFGSFVNSEQPMEVPDPYYGGGGGFDVVLDMVEEGCRNLINHILER